MRVVALAVGDMFFNPVRIRNNRRSTVGIIIIILLTIISSKTAVYRNTSWDNVVVFVATNIATTISVSVSLRSDNSRRMIHRLIVTTTPMIRLIIRVALLVYHGAGGGHVPLQIQTVVSSR